MRAIDGDALKDRLQSLAYDDWSQGVIISMVDAYRKCADIVEEQPTIEPRKGKWISYDEGDFDYDYKCSNCGYAVWDDSDFCPGCGAEMRGEQNEIN